MELSLQSFTRTEATTAVAAAGTLADAPGLCLAASSADRQEQSDTRFSLCCQLVMEWSGFAVSTLTRSAVVTSAQKPFLPPAARFQEQLGALRVVCRQGAGQTSTFPCSVLITYRQKISNSWAARARDCSPLCAHWKCRSLKDTPALVGRPASSHTGHTQVRTWRVSVRAQTLAPRSPQVKAESGSDR